MISFFRKIRKQLADDNQFFKYARYAIGEIVLVIVGILIAIQVNNWNEVRKAELQAETVRQNYLISVYKDLNSDVRTVDDIINRFSIQYETGIEVMEALESKGQKVIDSARISHIVGSILTDVIPNTRNENTWDGLKIRGNLTLIRDDSLNTLLNTVYTSFDRLTERFNQLPRKVRMDLREIASQCHYTNDLKSMNGSTLEDDMFGFLTSSNWKCILANNKLPKLASSITISAIINKKLYMKMRIETESAILYMENKYLFLNDTL